MESDVVFLFPLEAVFDALYYPTFKLAFRSLLVILHLLSCQIIEVQSAIFGGPRLHWSVSKDPVFMGVLLGVLLGADRFVLGVIAVYPVSMFHCFVLGLLTCEQYA